MSEMLEIFASKCYLPIYTSHYILFFNGLNIFYTTSILYVFSTYGDKVGRRTEKIKCWTEMFNILRIGKYEVGV